MGELTAPPIYHILLSIVCTFYMENNAEIFPVHMEGSWERV